MNKRLLKLCGLKLNPFSSQGPVTALWAKTRIQSSCWRIEQQIGEGGFALVAGDLGVGKNAALRLLAEHLNGLRDLCVSILTRLQSKRASFYWELGHLFGVAVNLRLLLSRANDLLVAASQQQREVLDEKLFFKVFSLDPKPAQKP